MINRHNLLTLFVLVVWVISPTAAFAHGFGERYDLPIPLYLYVLGGGLTVAISIFFISFILKKIDSSFEYSEIHVSTYFSTKLSFLFVTLVRVLSILVFIICIFSGFYGDQQPSNNIFPTFFWIIWWVGIAYISALIFNIHNIVNPWNNIYLIYENSAILFTKSKVNPWFEYPKSWGWWPAAIFMWILAWIELVYPYAALPSALSRILIVYSIITIIGMLAFGRTVWLKYGEIFNVVFDLFNRFSSVVFLPDRKTIVLRFFGMGLKDNREVRMSLVMTHLSILSVIAFDGFSATPIWGELLVNVYPLVEGLGSNAVLVIKSLLLGTFPLFFLLVYMIVMFCIHTITGKTTTISELAKTFILSLVPISIAYHLAHYLGFLLIQGQMIIPLISDPAGLGWDIFGTANYKPNIGIIDARFAWYASIVFIVIGHISAAYLSHVAAAQKFKDYKIALLSQYPMMVLMVLYTMLSLWMIAQPIVEYG